MPKLNKLPTRWAIRQLQQADENRRPRRKSNGFRRWKGLPKPKSMAPFNPLPIETTGLLRLMALSTSEQQYQDSLAKQRRAEIANYFKERKT